MDKAEDLEGISGSVRGGAPESWMDFVEALRRATKRLVTERDKTDAALKRTRRRLAGMADDLRRRCGNPPMPPGSPKELADKVREVVRTLSNAQAKILEDAEKVVEDFDHALENEDRFVVLVFGEVNAGKSGLANHLAGLEFGLEPSVRGVPFVEGGAALQRLAESPVECTREYQGFRLDGLLWIDCPGVLSATPENAELARRLVARADFIVFVTSSDAPFKRSEMDELARLIQADGAKQLEGCLVITKSDRIEEDVDEEGKFSRVVVPKAAADVREQLKWGREQLSEAGLTKLVRMREPHAVSLYVARDALGLRWDSGHPHRPRDGQWQARYSASGLPALMTALAGIIRKDGAVIKALWPKKRLNALKATVRLRLEPGEQRLCDLRALLEQTQEDLRAARAPASKRAGDLVASAIGEILERHGVRSTKQFDADAAEKAVRLKLKTAVTRVVEEDLLSKVQSATNRVEAVVAEFVRAAGFEFELKEVMETRTYESSEKGAAYGSVGGGAVGMAAGSLFGPIGTFVGGLLGSLAGRLAGRTVTEKRTVRVSKGTNVTEVVSDTQEAVRRQVKQVIGKVVATLESDFVKPMDAAIAALEGRVDVWRKTMGLGPRTVRRR